MATSKMKTLLKSQQGELDAVEMYLKLATHAPTGNAQLVFKQLASEEGHHANVFYRLTNTVLKPRKLKATAINCLSYIIGWNCLLKLMASGEYSAYNKYESVVDDYSDVYSVQQDEKRHGDMLLELRDEL